MSDGVRCQLIVASFELVEVASLSRTVVVLLNPLGGLFKQIISMGTDPSNPNPANPVKTSQTPTKIPPPSHLLTKRASYRACMYLL